MVGTALLVGSAFGVSHAFEADHVAAVATLVEDTDSSASTGVAWGLGHSVPILALGSMVLVLDLHIPPAVATAFEILVAGILILLGVRVITGYRPVGSIIRRHVHGHGDEEPAGTHRHLTIGGKQIGLTHSHGEETSFAVGIVHGLAGSGGVVVVLTATAPTSATGAEFLLGFAVASVAAMGVAAAGWGRIVGWFDGVRVAAGVASVLVGILLAAEIAGLVPTLAISLG